MTRLFDISLSLFGLIFGLPLLILLLIACWIDTRSPIFKQQRVGRDQKPFVLVKFRTMRPDTSSVATHLVSSDAVTKLGYFLRRNKLDELPQLWNVLKGEMSLVGARPCLYNQIELIFERQSRGIFDVRPGITGFAQIKGIDMSTPRLLAETEELMIKNFTLKTYFMCILSTVTGSGRGDSVKF
jgi:O-antigen biosynthesis protein WbqP